MKVCFAKLTLFLLLLPLWAGAQQNGIDAALQKGSAPDLGVHFAKTIDISLPGEEATLTADKAVEKLSAFFTQQTVKGYKRAHLSTPQSGRSNYTIGDLYTAHGTYRISLYFDAQQKIIEVRIQK
jgi:hypothetical protein